MKNIWIALAITLSTLAAQAHPQGVAAALVNTGARNIQIKPPAEGQKDLSTSCKQDGNGVTCEGPEGRTTCSKVGVSTMCTGSSGTMNCTEIGDSTVCTSANSGPTSCTKNSDAAVACTSGAESLTCLTQDGKMICR